MSHTPRCSAPRFVNPSRIVRPASALFALFLCLMAGGRALAAEWFWSGEGKSDYTTYRGNYQVYGVTPSSSYYLSDVPDNDVHAKYWLLGLIPSTDR